MYLSTSTTGGGELQPYVPSDRKRREVDGQLWNKIRASESKLGFGVYQDLVLINTSTLILPHWFGIMFFAALTIAPWICWSKRFSLRALLIGMTLVAALMGLAIWAEN
jgi:hypothetical protein